MNDPIRVLLIDDQPIISEGIKRMLAPETDIDFKYCSDPMQAMKMAKEYLPTVILQDLVMPNLDGLLLVRFLRAEDSPTLHVPLIVLSSKEDPVIKAKAFALGANDYLVKLPDAAELIARIRYHSRAYGNYLKRLEAEEMLQRENIRMSKELDIVRQMQQLILPRAEELAEISDLDIAGYMEPADEVGGDYYDVLSADGIVTIAMGDVTGHGLESGLLMVMAQTAVRTIKEIQEFDFVRFLETLNRTLYKNLQRMSSEKHLTLVIVNYADGKMSISGQHEETILVRKGGKIERIDTIDLGFPIGLIDEIGEFINNTVIELSIEDGIVLYTDGIPEAKNIDDEQYGLDRLCEIISNNWHLDSEQIQEAIIADLKKFIGKQMIFDDITLVIIKRKE